MSFLFNSLVLGFFLSFFCAFSFQSNHRFTVLFFYFRTIQHTLQQLFIKGLYINPAFIHLIIHHTFYEVFFKDFKRFFRHLIRQMLCRIDYLPCVMFWFISILDCLNPIIFNGLPFVFYVLAAFVLNCFKSIVFYIVSDNISTVLRLTSLKNED